MVAAAPAAHFKRPYRKCPGVMSEQPNLTSSAGALPIRSWRFPSICALLNEDWPTCGLIYVGECFGDFALIEADCWCMRWQLSLALLMETSYCFLVEVKGE